MYARENRTGQSHSRNASTLVGPAPLSREDFRGGLEPRPLARARQRLSFFDAAPARIAAPARRRGWLHGAAHGMTCQLGVVALPTTATLAIVVPFISHAATCPVLVSCHTRSALPLPLRSPTSLICQFAPLGPPTTATELRLVPLISHTAAWPVLSSHTMSALPSALRSPT